MTAQTDDIANRIAFSVLAKKRPTDMFKGVFFDINEETKQLADERSQEALTKVKSTLEKDLTSKGYSGLVILKLGSFRGHPYFTTAKITLKAQKPFTEGDSRLSNLLAYLQGKYSPKFKLKGVDKSGVASFNIR